MTSPVQTDRQAGGARARGSQASKTGKTRNMRAGGDRPLLVCLSALYGGLFGLTLWLAYSGNLPSWFQAIPYYDKPAHLGLYALATYLGHRLFARRSLPLGPWRIALFPLLFGLFTVAEELGQGLSPNRTLDGLDLLCSLLGVGLGYGLAQRAMRRQASQGSSGIG